MNITSDDGVRPVRVYVFVDFWNFCLSLPEQHKKLDWRLVGRFFADEAGKVINAGLPVSYEAMRVYGSYDPDMSKGSGFRHWFSNFLSAVPGVHTTFLPRQKIQSPPKCPVCHKTVSHCPSCKSDMRGTEEKGIDTAIVTDMMSLAWADVYDVAVLVSSDKDFIPVV